MPIKTTERDLGYSRITNDLKEVNKSFVTVGIHEDAGRYPADDENPNPPPVGLVAFKNEFGAGPTNPERSFMRSSIDENQSILQRKSREIKDKVLSGQMSVKNGLDSIGFMMTEMIRGKIETLRNPPNAPETIKNKPEIGNNPLVDSRLMKRSVNWKTFLKSK